ncbi:protein MAIN-LIKE 1-like [Rhododendron vialii]|uniref:protein MAIN-LIKE 1-like n=1 Tax=Rhododendron vialii TaxID=182163 RepID=UPI00265F2E55|nr:protein MAIN-LIKE 1-like [Rhododendron vialii]
MEKLLTDKAQEEQMARCFLLYMLGASLFPNRRNRVRISLLPALRDVGEIARFDWGGAALGTCYAFMGSLSRWAGVSLGGYWRVWELWTYEVLGMYPPETTCPDDTILPRALRWSKEYRGVKKGKGNLNAFRLFLNELRLDQVYWRIWDRFEVPYVARSREVMRGRVLLESPYDWQWYLGDLVSRQSLRLDAFRVPGPLLPLVQRTSQYTRGEFEWFTRLDPKLEPFFQAGAGCTADYTEYRLGT